MDSSPAYDFASVTPHDSTNFAKGLARGLYVGTTGDVVAITEGGTAVTFSSVPAGAILPVQCKRVNSTSTTASNIVALF